MPDLQVRSDRRRSVSKAAAWATPTIVIGAGAPALSASPGVAMAHRSQFQFFLDKAPWCHGTTRSGFAVSTIAAGTGVVFSNTRTSTAISNVYALLWFARPRLNWRADTGNSGCWTVPTSTGTSHNGLFQYRSVYTCAITPQNGTTTLQGYAWRTQCPDTSDAAWDEMRTYRRQAFGTVDGLEYSTDVSNTIA